MATSDAPLNVPNVTLAVARGPSPVLTNGVSIPQGIADGNSLVMTLDVNPGQRIRQQQPSFWEMGDDLRENGVANNYFKNITTPLQVTAAVTEQAEFPWRTTHPNEATRRIIKARTPSSNQSWSVYRDGYLNDPKAMGGHSPASDKKELYISWWISSDAPIAPLYRFTVESWSATDFIAASSGQDHILGEPIEIVSQLDGTVITGNIVQFDKVNGHITFQSTSVMYIDFNAEVVNVIGLTSGATATGTNPPVRLGTPGSNKFIRVWDDDPGLGFRHSWTSVQQILGGTPDSVWYATSNRFDGSFWKHLEFFGSKVDPANNFVIGYVDGVEVFRLASDFTTTDRVITNEGLRIALMGHDVNSPAPYGEMILYWGDIYSDHDPKHVVLTNAPTWTAYRAGGYKSEVQFLKDWNSQSNNSIEVEIFEGGLVGEPLYAYAVDFDGTNLSAINETGLVVRTV